jgi:ABC-type lipoprotein release transport system permease subunit
VSGRSIAASRQWSSSCTFKVQSALITSQFHGAEALDLSAFAQSAVFLITVMLAASAIPAMRAARVDVVASLKDG